MLMGNASKILQTVSANIDRDVVEPSILQLVDLILLTDTSGMLTGEEKVSVQGVSVAIQRETLRQRQIEFLTATNNPTDLKIVGLKGRAEVLRSVSTTIGMPGENIVPSEQQMEQMAQQEKQQAAQGGDLTAMVEKGVQRGVEAGVQRISTELTSGLLAQRAQLPEGPPAHLGTVAGAPQQPATNNPAMDLGRDQGAAQAQGNQPPKSSQSMGPQTHLTGNQPTPGGGQVQGGVG
jgi:hypothetical protein